MVLSGIPLPYFLTELQLSFIVLPGHWLGGQQTFSSSKLSSL